MVDFDAHKAVNALIRTHKAKARGRAAPSVRLNAFQQEAYVRVKGICDWRLGRAQMPDSKGNPVIVPMPPKTADEIVACLQRILRSIEMWQKEGRRRGYYNFVSEYVR